MNDEEIRSTIEQIKAQVKANPENKDKSDDEIDELILDSFFKSYTEGKMTKEDLLGLAEEMGYEPDEGFENDPNAPSQVDASAEGGEGGSPAPGAEGGDGKDSGAQGEIGDGAFQASDLEETRTMKPGETPEQFQEKIKEVKKDEDLNPEDDEESERKAASELWKMDLSKK